MCFRISKLEPNALIALEDIPVLKGLDHPYYYEDLEEELVTPWRRMIIAFDTPYKAEFSIFEDEIFEGLHSIHPDRVFYDESDYTFEAIIPKGATYYYNPEDNDYVSDTIIIRPILIYNVKNE